MSVLWKIPLILAAAESFQVATTPPTPNPSEGELVAPSTPTEKFLTNGLGRISGPTTPKNLFWAASICEIAVILARQRPYSPLGTMTLRYLAPAGLPGASSIGFTRPFIAGCVLAVLGTSLRYWCYRTLGRMFTFRLSIVKDHKLVTSGPYSIVRHPSYTGILLAVPGIQICLLGAGSWLKESGVLGTLWGKIAVAYWGFICTVAYPSVVARASKEDEMLKKRFGLEWDDWAKRVPYRLIPWII
ncbi:ICMT-domain-containing protein [Neolentinus lepideus HHB14362 ss-1]|uniref:Protein-S-isoprenylcysteine O-methyltransferase n=1 Tax=Neolentinus lepideus HHB14362 ss-1 TaxID=1314782 RepID=A0A165NIV8_9AGAM|nr:ICMT-domain-containing protein [Neolentinus lepideus HHB14362 ss-1]